MADESLQRFQNLLRTLFRSERADLDFGIYRIINYKREQIEAFIESRLPEVVAEAFSLHTEAEREAIDRELSGLRAQVHETLGEDALTADGELKEEFRETRLGRKYLEVGARLSDVQVSEDLRTKVYNDLFTFFSRYYEEGDFVSKRRYGKNEAYAIPYSGEEVILHWANKDQYYAKAADRFSAYRFKVGDFVVEFVLRNVQEGNGAGEQKRYVLPAKEQALQLANGTLSLAFECRPLTVAEEKQYGRTELQRPQEKIDAAVERNTLNKIRDPGLKAALARQLRPEGPSLLLRHIARFSRTNTSDFFIHKDLEQFLNREIDFFLKHEVLLLDDLLAGTAADQEKRTQLARVERDIAEKVIAFLAQIEDFQRRLFEKKKFVLRTEYCLTLDRVPEDLWDDVISSRDQLSEWQELFALTELLKADGKKKVDREFMKRHNTLTIDTRHFSDDFKWDLLGRLNDIDGATDGVLMKSENLQALKLLEEKYRSRIDCAYIDPPFNSGATEILYRNMYKHSSWLALMSDRIAATQRMLSDDAVFVVAIDENEQERLGLLLGQLFPNHEKVCVSVVHNPRGIQGENFAYCHEYAYFVFPRGGQYIAYKSIPEADWEYSNLRNWGGESTREFGKKSFYPIYVKDGNIVRLGDPAADDVHPGTAVHRKRNGEIEIWPIDQQGVERKWRYSRATLQKVLHLTRVVENSKEVQVQIAKADERYKTVWTDSRYDAGVYGSRLLRDIVGVEFSFPKSLYTVKDCLYGATAARPDAVVLDFFAGSGTTAHALIELNRDDGGSRKYVLVEMGDWFETVMLPRVRKVVFCSKWKKGRPSGGEGTSQLLKHCVLEQYADSLLNIQFQRAKEGQTMLDMFGDDYLLRYMLDFETKESSCLLNLEMFKEPFDYRLKAQQGDEIVEQKVDLVDTFNYLLGLHVQKMRQFKDSGRVYRAVLGQQDGRTTVIVWRSLVGLENDEDALLKDKRFIEERVLPGLLEEAKPDRFLANGPCFVEGAEAVEPEFNRLMFAGVAD